MAYGEQSIARTPVAYTIHVWPTQELVIQSWTWSDHQRAAYRQMAWAIGLAAATQVLDGGTFARREIGLETDIGWVKFTISQVATTVHIVVSEFSGPHAPGPGGGGEAQPHAIDGLVIGLRSGVDGTFHVVIFHGSVPTIPCTNRIRPEISRTNIYSKLGALFRSADMLIALKQCLTDRFDSHDPVWARALLHAPRQAAVTVSRIAHFGRAHDNAGMDRTGGTAATREGVGISSPELPPVIRYAENAIEIYFGATEMDSVRPQILPNVRNDGQRSCDLHPQ